VRRALLALLAVGLTLGGLSAVQPRASAASPADVANAPASAQSQP
jgi:hypothetical protein